MAALSPNDKAQRTIRQITSISEPELKDFVKIASEAFGDNDKSMLSLVGGDMSLKDELLTAMVRAALLEGTVYVVEYEGQVVSVALWFRQPMGLFKTDAQRALGYNDWFNKLPKDLQHWWTVDYPGVFEKYSKKFIVQEEWDKMWYCNLMVTDPKHQNNGHATFLMNHLTDKVREAGEILGLSTGSEVNASKYETMGFKERGRIVFHSLVNEFPCVWLTKE